MGEADIHMPVPGQMKLSGTGFMPLLVSLEWKRVKRGRRRGVWGGHGGVLTGGNRRWWWSECGKHDDSRFWEVTPEGSRATQLWTASPRVHLLLPFQSFVSVSPQDSGSALHSPVFSLALPLGCCTLAPPPPLNLPSPFSHPPTLSQHCTFSTCSSPASSRFYDSVEW